MSNCSRYRLSPCVHVYLCILGNFCSNQFSYIIFKGFQCWLCFPSSLLHAYCLPLSQIIPPGSFLAPLCLFPLLTTVFYLLFFQICHPWPLTSFLPSLVTWIQIHISKDSKVASTYEEEPSVFVFLDLGVPTQNNYFQLHPSTSEIHFHLQLSRIPLCICTTFHYFHIWLLWIEQ